VGGGCNTVGEYNRGSSFYQTLPFSRPQLPFVPAAVDAPPGRPTDASSVHDSSTRETAFRDFHPRNEVNDHRPTQLQQQLPSCDVTGLQQRYVIATTSAVGAAACGDQVWTNTHRFSNVMETCLKPAATLENTSINCSPRNIMSRDISAYHVNISPSVSAAGAPPPPRGAPELLRRTNGYTLNHLTKSKTTSSLRVHFAPGKEPGSSPSGGWVLLSPGGRDSFPPGSDYVLSDDDPFKPAGQKRFFS